MHMLIHAYVPIFALLLIARSRLQRRDSRVRSRFVSASLLSSRGVRMCECASVGTHTTSLHIYVRTREGSRPHQAVVAECLPNAVAGPPWATSRARAHTHTHAHTERIQNTFPLGQSIPNIPMCMYACMYTTKSRSSRLSFTCVFSVWTYMHAHLVFRISTKS